MGNGTLITPPVSFVKELVVLGQIGHDGPLGTFRYVVDKATRTIWYVGDEGEIMQNVMDRGQYDIWLETGAVAVYPAGAEVWDSNHDWDEMFQMWEETDITDNVANSRYWYNWSVLMIIEFWLRKTGEDGPNGDKIRKMYKAYERGLCTFVEMVDYIATDNGYGV